MPQHFSTSEYLSELDDYTNTMNYSVDEDYCEEGYDEEYYDQEYYNEDYGEEGYVDDEQYCDKEYGGETVLNPEPEQRFSIMDALKKKTPPKNRTKKKKRAKKPPTVHSIPKSVLENITQSLLVEDEDYLTPPPVGASENFPDAGTNDALQNVFKYRNLHHAAIKLKSNAITWSNNAQFYASCPVNLVLKEDDLNKRHNFLFVHGGVDAHGALVDKCFLYDLETGEEIIIPPSPVSPPPQVHHKCFYSSQRDEITLVTSKLTHIYTLNRLCDLGKAQWSVRELNWGWTSVGHLKSLFQLDVSTILHPPMLAVVASIDSYRVVVPYLELVNERNSPKGRYSFVVSRIGSSVILYAVGVNSKGKFSICKIEWDYTELATLYGRAFSHSRVHFRDAQWERVGMKGVVPPACSAFSLVMSYSKDAIIMYGGRLNNEKSMCSFYRFDLLNETWDVVLPLYGRENLKPIFGHSMVCADHNTVVVYDGHPHTNELFFVNGFVTLNNEHGLEIATHLRHIWTEKTVYDCLIEVSDGVDVEAHCCILSARCPGLRASLREKFSISGDKESGSVVRLSEFSKFSKDAVLSFMEFVYTGEFCVAKEHVDAFCKMTTLTECGKAQVAMLLSDYSSVNLHHYSKWTLDYMSDLESLLGENGEFCADATVMTEIRVESGDLIPPGLGDDSPFEHSPELPVRAHQHHLAILCRNKHLSRVFMGSFEEAQSKVLHLTDQDPDALDVLIKYLYTDCLTLSAENCITVYNVAFALGCTEVLQICRSAIVDFINEETVLSIAHFGEATQDQTLLSRCKAFIAARFTTIGMSNACVSMLSEGFRHECEMVWHRLQVMKAKRKKKAFLRRKKDRR